MYLHSCMLWPGFAGYLESSRRVCVLLISERATQDTLRLAVGYMCILADNSEGSKECQTEAPRRLKAGAGKGYFQAPRQLFPSEEGCSFMPQLHTCIYIYIYICIYVYIFIHTYMHTYMHMFICTYTYVCMYVGM